MSQRKPKSQPGKRAVIAAGGAVPDKTPEDFAEWQCGHYGNRRKDGKLCGARVAAGTHHCVLHAGLPKTEHMAMGRLRLEYEKWTLTAHDGSNLVPPQEILRCISFWKFKADLYGRLLAESAQAAERLQAAHVAGTLLLKEAEEETYYDEHADRTVTMHEDPALQAARQDLERIFNTGAVSVFVGNKYDVDRNGRVFAVEEGRRALAAEEERAHTMLARFLGLATQAKIAELQVKLAEHMGLMIQTVIVGVLRAKGIDVDRTVYDLVVEHMDKASATMQPQLAA